MTGHDADRPDGDRRDEPELVEAVEVEPSAVIVPLDQRRGARNAAGDDQAEDLAPARLALVDAPVDESPTRPPAAPRPVLPGWVKSWPAFTDAASWWLRHSWHVTAFHGIRLPLYLVRLLGRSPFGVARLLGIWWRWGTDPDGRQMRSAMNTAGADPAVFVRLTEQHRAMVRNRLLVTALIGCVAGWFGWAVIVAASPATITTTALALLVVLGAIGRSADRPLTSRSVDSEAVPRLTADLIVTALGSLGIAELNKSLKPGSSWGSGSRRRSCATAPASEPRSTSRPVSPPVT